MNCWALTGSSKDDCLPDVVDLCFALRIDPGICQAYLDHLIDQNLLTRRQGSGKIVPKNWDDRQFLSDSSTDRVRKYREKFKKPVMKRDETVSVTVQDSDTDTDTDQTQTPNPTEARAVTPALDEKFQEFKYLYEQVGDALMPEDFTLAWHPWCVLDNEQRQVAIDGLKARISAKQSVLHQPANYLRSREYRRPIRKVTAAGNGRMSSFDQINRAIEEA